MVEDPILQSILINSTKRRTKISKENDKGEMTENEAEKLLQTFVPRVFYRFNQFFYFLNEKI
jgi:hypothetical protein